MKQIRLILSTIFVALTALLGSQKAQAQFSAVTVNILSSGMTTSSCVLPATYVITVEADLTGTAVLGDSVTMYVNWGDGTSNTLKFADSNWVYNNFSHNYTFPGSFTPYASVTATGGATGFWAATPTAGAVTVTDTCAPITGKLFLDNNHNCIQDAGEQGIYGAPIFLINNTLMDTTLYDWTDVNGHYSVVAPAGNYTILANPAYAYTLFWPLTVTPTADVTPSCPAGGLYSLTTVIDSTYNKDFADTCATLTSFDVMSGGCIYGAVPGDTTWVQVIAGNAWWYWAYTCETFTTTLTLNLDPHLHYTGIASVPPTSISGSTFTWNISTTGGPFYAYPRIKVYTDSGVTIGDTVFCTVNATATSFPDPDMSNNTRVFSRIVSASWDPNEVAVSPQGYGAPGYINNSAELTYTIHFQNTGTAAAHNITVIDTTSANLDLRTVHIMASSNPVEMYQEGNLLKFRFNNINLPDSMSNPNGSIGSVTYNVLPKKGLAPGTQIYNRANIFFDYNPGVETNRVLNTIAIPTVVNNVTHKILSAQVYPNPANNTLFASSDDHSDFVISLTDMLGRVLYNGSSANGMVTINTQNLPAGIYIVKLHNADGMEMTTKATIQH